MISHFDAPELISSLGAQHFLPIPASHLMHSGYILNHSSLYTPILDAIDSGRV